mmetsp:Transcript_7935/g.24502  ORF Transcript_7935/g.24502 Transcript_7935/m.24502 type:complete len:124 (+) Transcript_7935:861-1232(+)
MPGSAAGNESLAARASFRASSERMLPVGHATAARCAASHDASSSGCARAKLCPLARPNSSGAIHRHVSQSMQLESTKSGPGAFVESRAGFDAFGVADMLHAATGNDKANTLLIIVLLSSSFFS